MRDVVGAQSRVLGAAGELTSIRLDRGVERVEIESDGVRLRGDLHIDEHSGPLAFVVSHGWGSERPVDIPAALAAEGFPTVAYDLRGHGTSGGDLATASRAQWVADLVAAHSWLSRRLPGCRIGLVGASFGAYLSLVALEQCDVAAVSLRVPANFLDDGFDAPHAPRMAPEVRTLDDLRPADSAALRALRTFDGLVQLVDADQDAVIPPETAASYVAAVAPERLRHSTLRDAPHHLATPQLRAAYIDLLVSWATGVVAA